MLEKSIFLKKIKDDITVAGKSERMTVRVFLQKFDMKRRGSENTQYINELLEHYGLRTKPEYSKEYIDNEIEFVLLNDAPLEDPLLRVSSMKAASNRPICVNANDPVERAISIMIGNNFSQVPVMQGDKNCKGLFSWQSYCIALFLNKKITSVSSCCKPCIFVFEGDPLEKVIDLILRDECILVKDREHNIKGIVTDSDLTGEFRDMSEGFRFILEVETILRNLIKSSINISELSRIRRDGPFKEQDLKDVNSLFFSEYELICNDDIFWGKIGLPYERKYFIELLRDSRVARNEIMHFSKDLKDSEAYQSLDSLRTLLQSLDGLLYKAA